MNEPQYPSSLSSSLSIARNDMDGARDAASDAAKRVAQHTMDAAVSALALCPRTLILLDAFHPVGSHERAEFISRLMALAALHYAQHMASHRAWRSSARAWTKMMDGDSRGTLAAIAGACAWAGFGAEPLRLSRRTYRALLGRELATRIGNDAIERVMDEKSLAALAVVNPANGQATGADPLAASVAAPTFARMALDAAANGVEAFVDLIYHGHCLFQSNPWTAPALFGCAVYGQIMSSSRMFDDDEAKKEAHRAETASNRLRELLIHANANGEAIALANGCKVEAEEAMATLEAGQEFVYRRQVLNARSRFPADIYAAVANFLPMVAILPKLTRGEPVSAWNVQIAMTAFNGIRSALGILAENVTTLRTAEMHAAHVSNLYESLDALHWQGGESAMEAITSRSIALSVPEDDMSLVEVEGLVLMGHDGMAVIRNLDLVLCRGDSLAIVGPPQCGKTVLVKALIGLWTKGSGSARVVDRRSICVLSRRPYVPMGTLLDVCTYPLPASDVGSETRSVISKVMVELGLSKYIEYLDTISPWTDLMSLSEQQRFAVCRAVVSKAELCILDDATSAMDPKDRAIAYRVLKEHVGGILSLGDEISLPRLHERTIRIHANGSWSDFTHEETAPPKVESQREEQVLQPRSVMEQQRTTDNSEPKSFSPLQMDATRRENQFLRRQKKNVARALGVKPEKLGVVPTPTKTEKKSPRSSPSTRSLSFDPLA
jgi:ABC-type Mn2+/Zn2+ transport system ATPase subunit